MNITKIIKETAKEYMVENQCSLWDINNGFCEDFAQTVIQKLGGYKDNPFGVKDNLFEMSGDMFFNVRDIEFAKENWPSYIETDYGVWSDTMLTRWGYPTNVDLHKIYVEINHTWVYFNGKHYDAGCPNGVEKWFELPLIKTFMLSCLK